MQVADGHVRALLAHFGVRAVAAKSMLAIISTRDAMRRGWIVALERASHREIDVASTAWLKTGLRRLAKEEATDGASALAAEVEAGLRLSWIGSVLRPSAGKRPTCDFRVGPLNVEVYSPQPHVEERRVVQADLATRARAATIPCSVAIAISHPTTGSGRKVDGDGHVVRDRTSQAASFPTNKLIDRILSRKKREAKQFVAGEQNILWLDLKHGLEFSAVHSTPIRSIVSKGSCFVGMNGV